MYFRLTQVDVQEGKMDETIAYASGVMDSFVDTPGLYQICIAEMSNGQMTSWTTWASEDAMNAAGPQIQEALGGLADYIAGPPTISHGPMNAGQIYQSSMKGERDGEPFVVRLGFGAEYQDGKLEEATDWVQNTVYAGYEGTDGLMGALAADVGGSVVTMSTWENQESLDASQEKFQEIMADAMKYIKNPPTVVTGVCNLWRNNVSFPAGKLSQWKK